MNSDKQQAIGQIAALVQQHAISMEEIGAALGRQQIESNKKDAFTLTRVFSYLGGIFILSGIGGYTALQWQYLNSFSRILITLGPGIIFMILAIAAALQNRREKNVTIFVILSALLQSTGLFVAVAEFSTGGGDLRMAAFAIFGVLAVQYGLVFSKLKRTSLLFFTIYFAMPAFASICDLIGIPNLLNELVCGISLMALSYGIQRTPYNSICGFGYFVSSIILLWMGFDWLEGTHVELLYVGVAAFMLYISTIVGSRSILATSTIALFSYISYFTQRYFLHSVGWPIFLIMLGFVFFGLSSLALKINKRIAA